MNRYEQHLYIKATLPHPQQEGDWVVWAIQGGYLLVSGPALPCGGWSVNDLGVRRSDWYDAHPLLRDVVVPDGTRVWCFNENAYLNWREAH